MKDDVTRYPKRDKCPEAIASHRRSDAKRCTGLYNPHEEVVGVCIEL